MSWLSNATVYDRRRLGVAVIVTLVIIPILWWTRSSSSSQPPESPVEVGPVSESLTPGFLSGSRETVPRSTFAPNEPAPEDALLRSGLATYKNFGARQYRPKSSETTLVPTTVLPRDVCIINFLPEGTKVTVENTDNGRSISCRVRWQTIPPGIIVVLNAPLFQKISELAQAPIPVRLSW
jgi:hypothetical protein